MVSSSGAGEIASTAPSAKPSSVNKKAEKREVAMAKILNATLDLIARKGLAALSHRSIASEAGVQLAMTTYYFGTIDNILVEAFREYRKSMEPVNMGLITAYSELLARCVNEQGELTERDAYIEGLAGIFAELIDTGPTIRLRQLQIECQFLYEQHPSPALEKETQSYNNELAGHARDFIAPLATRSPDLDAQMFLWMIQSLEFSQVTSAGIKGQSSREVLVRLLRGFLV
ncbi:MULTISPECIES: TetR/AcrR family transcriptional regulator [Microbulbifer]|uniref:TetR/AcrR family transcriptional regulator n=1 Tax=Microbulbifer TaxID=48073 RepID=UPI001CD5DA19|nr:TetR/AcrR family transcriptional regulator [Microbulbifer agarilyticus]MCA0900407.1 TetR family transcriptional regulator [Microbulbifer agarilyticus]